MEASSDLNTSVDEKIKLRNRIIRWAYSDYFPVDDDYKIPEDTTQIASILQAIGYKLETIEYAPIELDSNETDQIKIHIHCGKSGLRAKLTKDCTICSCPNKEKTNAAKLWTVSGCGPSASQDNLNKIDQTYSSLLPVLSEGNSQIIKDVLSKMFTMIKDTDMNQNTNDTSKTMNCTRSRSLDVIIRKPPLVRKETWEVDPKTSPPLKTSSPIPDLCASIDLMTLQTNKEQMFANILTTIKENIDKALALIPPNSNSSGKTLKRVSNIKPNPIITTPTRSTSGSATPDLPLRRTPMTMKSIDKKKQVPIKSATIVSSGIKEKRFLGIQSKIGSIRKKPDYLTPTTSRPASLKKDTPHPNSGQTGSSDGKRPGLGLISKSPSLRGSNPNLTFTNNIAPVKPKPKSNIPSFTFKAPSGKSGIISKGK